MKSENGANPDDELGNSIINEVVKTYIIDASVVIKWFSDFNENDLNKAELLRNDYLNKKIYLIAPDILIAEISNALSYNPNFDCNFRVESMNYLFLHSYPRRFKSSGWFFLISSGIFCIR